MISSFSLLVMLVLLLAVTSSALSLHPTVPTEDVVSIPGRYLKKSKQRQSKEEKEYMKYHKCADVAEAYGASYFITKEYMLKTKVEKFNLTWVNCEMGSFVFLKRLNGKTIHHKNVSGTTIQSLDVLDFSVIHLSAYERLQRRHKGVLRKMDKKALANEVKIEETLKHATDSLVNTLRTRAATVSIVSNELNRTVAIMPFLGHANGAGHSNLSNRYLYLKACFWSIYAYIPNVVAVVKSQVDYDFCKKDSGLPFYDVIYAKDLPKSASLPVATSQQVKKRIQDGRYDFDYIYFTESDQILMLRSADAMLRVLKDHPNYVLVPHRLMPYPKLVVNKMIKREPHPTTDLINGWTNVSCCLERQNCLSKRKEWRPVADPNVSMVHAYGLIVPLGNSNFLAEQYRYCKLMPERVDVCP